MSVFRSTLNALPRGNQHDQALYDQLALALRLGLGILFITGGCWKLSRAIDPASADALVALYISDKGYINSFFLNYLFDGALGFLLSPWLFLTALSTFELLSGIALVAGFLVRPLSLIYGLLLWSFVFSLPVTTSPGASIADPTYMAPAMFVQIRDIGLSGMFFVLYNLGSGAFSVDQRLALRQPDHAASWDHLGLLLRLSLGVIFVIGGFFAGMPNIKDFGVPGFILAVAGLAMMLGVGVRLGAAVFLAVMLYYMASKLSFDKGLLDNLNAVKREIAFVPAAVILALMDGGRLFSLEMMLGSWRSRRDLPATSNG